ncbi:hypothetical protein ACMA1D_11835 [Streptomyces sp. 796.1]|uniref:hypothetical protein n=1 Tax=Streptomyces sp. 796.1 TaxID=3163029 RepID=UPI0039C9CC1A
MARHRRRAWTGLQIARLGAKGRTEGALTVQQAALPGALHAQRTHKVCIAAGIKDGQTARLRELDGPGTRGGTPEDLHTTMRVVDRLAAGLRPATAARAPGRRAIVPYGRPNLPA